MALYDFNSVFLGPPHGVNHTIEQPGSRSDPEPSMDARPVGVQQSSDVEGGRTKILGNSPGSDPSYIEEFLMPGFRALDESMKMYFSGIRVPTKDSYRVMRVKVAGADKSVGAWKDELLGGRARLPVASLDRSTHEFNKDKFSPAYFPMTRRFLSRRGDRVALIYRPVPFLVSYVMTIWGQRKRDMEYITAQIVTRFNPLAEFVMFDQHIRGAVQLRFSGLTDSSDKEAGVEQLAKLRYEISMQAEAWLPLPEKIVPTILGQIATISERSGAVLLSTLGNPGISISPVDGV